MSSAGTEIQRVTIQMARGVLHHSNSERFIIFHTILSQTSTQFGIFALIFYPYASSCFQSHVADKWILDPTPRNIGKKYKKKLYFPSESKSSYSSRYTAKKR
uniref:Ovule protein n=1 Tax=Ascaris lumbricoides TaxID=6252 RepID=A0A0M3HVX8_ASCLU